MEQTEIYHDVTELLETNDFSCGNKYLKLGWRLLHVGKTSDGQT